MSDSFYKRYLKYKLKYLQLKNNIVLPNLLGGGENVDDELKQLMDKISQIEEMLPRLGSEINEHNLSQLEQQTIKDLNKKVRGLVDFIKDNDIPLDCSSLEATEIQQLKNVLDKMKGDLSVDKLQKQYNIRTKIYTLDETNVDEILDYIMTTFNIRSEQDISNLFRTNILGYNKNNVIFYMVLFRYLIVNKKQLSTEMKLPFLTRLNIKMALDLANNSEEYLPLFVQIINSYIMSFPIKKIINLANTINPSLIYTLKENVVEFNSINKSKLIETYNVKNKIIEYSDGNIKEITKADYNDLQQVVFVLYKIPVFKI